MPEQKNIIKAIETIVEEKNRESETRIRKEITDFKDEILTNLDANNKKLDNILTEHPSMNGAIDENRNNIKDHETRIHKVEAKTGLA
jgi:predicted  nucleic acid-binding Zn-ribbon protein